MTNAKEAAVLSFLELFHTSSLDLDAIRAALAPGARWQPVVPIAPTVEGADAICAEAERQYQIYVDCKCEVLNIASSGDTVFTERVDSVRTVGADKEVITRVTGVFTLDANDKIVFWREYWDMLDIADQLGMTGEQLRGLMDTR